MTRDGAASIASDVTSPLRIVFVVTALHGGGAESVAEVWMAWLAGRGHDVSVVLTGGAVDRAHLPSGVAALSLAERHGHLAKAVALGRVLNDRRPDAAFALQTYPNVLLLLASRLLRAVRRPAVLVSEHNIVSLGLVGADLPHRVKVAVARRTYSLADHVVAVSHAVAGEAVGGFGVSGDRVSVVPLPATAKITDPRTSSRVPGDANGIQIVLACRLVRQKQPHRAIEAAVELQRRGVAVEVVSFGGGPLLGELIRAAGNAGIAFRHEGWVEDWFDRFGPNAVALLPSDREGFGVVLVEAAAAGYPSVALSGALGVADAIVPGMTGELARSADAGDIADALLDGSKLTLEGIDPWLRRFSLERSGRDLERVLRRTAARHMTARRLLDTSTPPNRRHR